MKQRRKVRNESLYSKAKNNETNRGCKTPLPTPPSPISLDVIGNTLPCTVNSSKLCLWKNLGEIFPTTSVWFCCLFTIAQGPRSSTSRCRFCLPVMISPMVLQPKVRRKKYFACTVVKPHPSTQRDRLSIRMCALFSLPSIYKNW